MTKACWLQRSLLAHRATFQNANAKTNASEGTRPPSPHDYVHVTGRGAAGASAMRRGNDC